MSVSYLLTTENGGYNFNLDTLVSSIDGIMKISKAGSGTTERAVPSLALAATSTAANDYMAGNTSLAAIAGITFATGDLLLGNVGVDGAVDKLAIGTNTQVLTSNGTTAAWATGVPIVSGGAATAGTATILSLGYFVTVSTTAVQSTSLIFLDIKSFVADDDLLPYGVANIINGTSFEIHIPQSAGAAQNIDFSWLIINP